MILSFQDTEKLLQEYKLEQVKTVLVYSKKELIQKIQKFNYPIVLKISSQKHFHRKEVNGFILNIKTEKEAVKAYQELIKIKNIEGILIQEQIKGIELIIGIKNDPVFQTTIMFGIGGSLVEVYQDVSFRIAPINKKKSLEMIEQIKGKKLLDGFRNGPIIDKKKLAEIISRISYLGYEKKIKELDFNPLIANEKGIFICDAKIIYD